MAATLTGAGYRVHGIDIVAGDDARQYFADTTHGFDLVVHAAAVVGGRQQIDGDPLSLAVNLELDAAMFAWAARTRPGRVVYLSSSAVYPVALQGPAGRLLSEDAVTLNGPIIGTPDALYGWAKLTGERLAGLARAEGVPVTVCRPFSGFGEDQDVCYPFAAMGARARAREDPFVIWGTGDQVRDFVHVDDICAAVLAMIAEGIDGPVNLGTGRGTSMRELAAMMCDAAGYQPEFRPLPGKPSGVAYRVADVTRMRGVCEPRISLGDGIARVLRREAAVRHG